MKKTTMIAANGIKAFLFFCLVVSAVSMTAMVHVAPARADNTSKIYWHFVFKAFVHMPDRNAVEWAWVTMVEMPKEKAFPAEAQTARQYGGTLQGTVLAFVRGTAWRSSHRYELDDRCSGHPSTKIISWEESDSDSVFCAGQLYEPQPYRDGTGRVTLGGQMFSLGFTNRKILHEDGRWEDLKGQAQVFVGAINVEGRSGERTKGRFHLQEVNYRDNLKHYKSCGKSWVEQYRTGFRHFAIESLRDIVVDVGQSNWGAVNYGFQNRNQILYSYYRSTSREHPHWKIRHEWLYPIMDRTE